MSSCIQYDKNWNVKKKKDTSYDYTPTVRVISTSYQIELSYVHPSTIGKKDLHVEGHNF